MLWPAGKSSAFVATFDFDAEEVWLAEDAGYTERPGVLSQGTFGATVGLPLVLDALRATGLTATFFVPGRVAQRYPGRVQDILADGHEIGLHGLTHRSPDTLSRTEEAAELDASLDILRGLGADPVGYRAPGWELSPHTLNLLDKRGVRYSSNLMDQIEPYRHPGHDLVELPVHWSLDDAPHFWFDGRESWQKTVRTPSEVREIWSAEFEGIRRLGGLTVLTAHPQFIGRPGRVRMLAEVLQQVMACADVWATTAREVAVYADERVPRRAVPKQAAARRPRPEDAGLPARPPR